MDDLVIFHRHDEGPVEMQPVSREHVDHVVVTHVRCMCGSQRAVVSRVARPDGTDVAGWSYQPSHPTATRAAS